MTRAQLAVAIRNKDTARLDAWADRVLAAQKVDQRRPKIKLARSKRPGAVARKARKEERNARMGVIAEAVKARANGRCEAWVPMDDGEWIRCGNTAHVVDHWFGGFGRRQHREAVPTCWMLCRIHDLQRTNNEPSAARWNISFDLHCKTHGYTFTPHITRPTRQEGGR